MIQLMLDKDDAAAEFSGPCRLSVGFMQSVLELFTLPGDIVMDWTVGVGNTYLAGEYCGRFVIGVENRIEFLEVAKRVLKDLEKRETKKGEAKLKSIDLRTDFGEEEKDDGFYDFGGDNTSGTGSQTTFGLDGE